MRERPPADTFAPLAEAELATIPAGDSPGECIIPVPPDAPPMHADRRDDTVDREHEIEEHDLTNRGRESPGLWGLCVSLFIRIDCVVDFARRLENEEQPAGDQNKVAPGKILAQNREQRRGEMDDVGRASHEQHSEDKRQADPDAPRLRRLRLRQSRREMATKTRLSTPSTISIAISVTRASQAEGSAASAKGESVGKFLVEARLTKSFHQGAGHAPGCRGNASLSRVAP